MPEFLTCFACEQEPTQQCPRCGRPYCDEHGEDVCDACLNPASGLPSFTLYRGSLLVMLVGAALALWLLIQPPGGESNAPQAGTIITPTAQVQVNITAPAGTTPTGSNGSPSPNTTARPNATATPGASGSSGTYTVVSGDTLSSICERVKPASMSVPDCVDQVRTLNGISGDSISVGQTLRIPQ